MTYPQPDWWDLTRDPQGVRRSPSPGATGWSPDQRRWVALKWKRIREAQQTADASNNEWNRLNDEINDHMDRHGVTEVVQRAKVKGESLALKDALERGKWHAANAQRHIDDLMLFLKLKEMGLL